MSKRDRAIKYVILSTLNNKSVCGYDVIKIIFQNHHLLLSQGTVYPALYSLKEDGYVDVFKSNQRTSYYMLTDKGRDFLNEGI